MSTLTLQQSAALVGRHCWVERRLFELLGAWSVTAPSDVATLTLDRHSQHAAWRAEQWWARLPVLAGVDRQSLVVAGPRWSALAGPALAGPALAGPAPADPAPSGAGPEHGGRPGRAGPAPGGPAPGGPAPGGPALAGPALAGAGPEHGGRPGRGAPNAGGGDPAVAAPAGDGRPQGATAAPADGIGRLAVAYRVLLPRLAVAYARHAEMTTPVADGPVIRTLGQVRADLTGDWAEGEALVQDLIVDAGSVAAVAAAVAAAERAFLA
jgi:hypothetical protein